MKITLTTPKTVIVKPSVAAETATINEVEVVTISDNCEDTVQAIVTINGVDKVLVLWQDEAYINIGNWTQTQANNRIKELL